MDKSTTRASDFYPCSKRISGHNLWVAATEATRNTAKRPVGVASICSGSRNSVERGRCQWNRARGNG